MDSGVTTETDFIVNVGDEKHLPNPERRAVLDYLATLPEDMPLMVLTPQSQAEMKAAAEFSARCHEAWRYPPSDSNDEMWAKASDAKVSRMRAYSGKQQLPLTPPSVHPRLAGLPITEGDE